MARVAIVGSRRWPFPGIVTDAVDLLPDDTVVVSGGAIGVDVIAEGAARARGLEVVVFKPDWKKYGKRAAFVRNKLIVDAADVVLAFQFRGSRGTQHSMNYARFCGKPVEVVTIE